MFANSQLRIKESTKPVRKSKDISFLCTDSVKVLGIIVDSILSWDLHDYYIVRVIVPISKALFRIPAKFKKYNIYYA